jgi:acyl-[acyl-carrier-protein]-phospholipid O-acyltransferase / long-chain-fatty-acid--[acyl-carrier-protein] ligase
MIMKGVVVLRSDRIPTSGAVVLPTHLSDREAAEVERQLGGRTVVRFGAVELAGGWADEVRETVARGGFAIFVPAPTDGWPAHLSDVPKPLLEEVLALELPILPLAVDRPLLNGLSIDDRSIQAEGVCCFAPVIAPAGLTVAAVQEAWLQAGEEAFSTRPGLDEHLARTVLRGLKRHGSSVRIVDGSDDSELTYEQVLAASIALSRVIKAETASPRIGIVLPPGKAGLIANLAALLAGKIPVNLNYTAGKSAIESALRQSEIDRILTVDLVVRKMQEFPWLPTRKLILIERLMPGLKMKAKFWGTLARVLPASVLATILGLPSKGGDSEAALLFTSGSSGEPKGVILTHRNLIANVTQFGMRIGLGPGDKALGCLPLFHCFGFTVTLWYVLIEGVGLVTYPTPLDTPKLASLVEKHAVTMLLSTPTFLRGYLRKARPEQLAAVRLVVTGAEKLPRSVAESFRGTFGRDVLEGYGLTETAPATNINLPERPPPPDGREVMPSLRHGSVGQLLPGIALRLTDPITERQVPVDQTGIIWFKGPNVFPGYLKQPRKTEEVVKDGWFRTGDLGRLDGDGFLYIEGRLSRFSKIGGEMIPHETVEEHIIRALGLEGASERKVAVVGVPDPDKGEALVLLSTVAGETIKQEIIQLRYALLDQGVPALWIPKRMLRVMEIPLLASGKMDLRKCAELAQQAAE